MAGFATSPETKPQYNNTAFGVYKGILVGSSGIIKLVINNGDSMVKAYIFLDNITKDTLTCTQKFTNGQAITNARFAGRISTMNFSVNADGTKPSIVNITIVGHSNISGQIIHETSVQQVYCYEGMYTGSEQGVFNCIRFGSSLIGLVKCSCGDIFSGNGQITDNAFSAVLGNLSSGATFNGSFGGDNCQGTWQNASVNGKGEFKGKRTL
jgi:hypothetical protein